MARIIGFSGLRNSEILDPENSDSDNYKLGSGSFFFLLSGIALHAC